MGKEEKNPEKCGSDLRDQICDIQCNTEEIIELIKDKPKDCCDKILTELTKIETKLDSIAEAINWTNSFLYGMCKKCDDCK